MDEISLNVQAYLSAYKIQWQLHHQIQGKGKERFIGKIVKYCAQNALKLSNVD